MSVFVNQRIDFNNPMINKPSNLQNSAVLRMLEEEENRKRSGQPGSLKRVAWPPPPEENEEFIEQPAVQSQGGPVNPTKTSPGPQVYHIPIQQPNQEPTPQKSPPQKTAPPQKTLPQAPPPQKPSTPQYKPEEPKLFTSSTTFQPTSPVSPQPQICPSLSKSPVDFTSLAKPWSPQLSPTSSQYRTVNAPTVQSSYKSSKVTEYSSTQQYKYSSQSQSETQPVLQIYSTSSKESTFEEHPTIYSKDTSSFTQSTFNQTSGGTPVFRPAPPPEFKQQAFREESQPSKLAERILTVKIERSDPEEEGEKAIIKPTTPKKDIGKQQAFVPKTTSVPLLNNNIASQPQYSPPQQQYSPSQQQYPPPQQQYSPPQKQYSPTQQSQQTPSAQTYQQPPKQVQFETQTFVEVNPSLAQAPPPKLVSLPPQQLRSSSDQLAPSQQGVPQPQRTLTKPKPVEPPPSTITLRPQAPVSQAPPPLVSSQPATAKFGGGKNLRGDLKWPPEEVKEKMEAEKQHLLDLAKGPACRPRKQHRDYMPFFAKHQLNSTYPGYKIPPGTQFYDHNPVM